MKLIKSKVFVLFILALVSIAVIFFRFNVIPKNLTFDEVEFAKLALSLDGKSYAPYSELATGHSTLYFYFLLMSFKLFGVGNFALRFPSALFGVAGSLMFYLLMERVFKKNHLLAFLLSILFIITRWYFNFARFSFEATFLIFLELTSLFFLLDQQKSRLSLILSGVFAGLAFNSYTPGRFFFAVPLLYIGSMYLKNKKDLIRKILVFIVPFLIVITPLTFYLAANQDNRVDKLFFWKNHEMTLGEKVTGTMKNIGTVSSMFVFKGDMSGKHNYPGKPALNPFVGLFFIAGLIIALRNFKDLNHRLFLAYFFLSLLPSFMIYPWENPNMLRTITAIPSVIFFMGVAISAILEKKKHLPYIMVVVALLTVGSAIYELRTYFVYQAKVFPSAFETKPSLEESLKHTNFKYDQTD
jgi:4-amino-4-deoxy-L-arabinose transferase-like glycosyltransferase